VTQDIPAPVPVAELIAQRKKGRYYARDGYLGRDELEGAWPVVWQVEAVAKANDVRTVTDSGTGTYGTSYRTVFHADDVQRVADEIADGTAVLQPLWRRDTEEGSEALRQQIKKWDRQIMLARLVGTAIVLLLVVGFGVLISLD
jgi:hypothetical protein